MVSHRLARQSGREGEDLKQVRVVKDRDGNLLKVSESEGIDGGRVGRP